MRKPKIPKPHVAINDHQRTPGGRDTVGNIPALAARLDVSEALCRTLKRSGSKAFGGHGRIDVEMAREDIAKLPPIPIVDNGELEDKETLERRRLRAQWLTVEFNLEVLKRLYIPVAEARADAVRIGSAQRSEDMRLVGDVGTWEGLSAADMNARAREWFDQKCRTLSDELSALYQ